MHTFERRWLAGALIAVLWVSALCAEETAPPAKPDVPAAKIEFLDGEAAKAAIVDDKGEPYFERLQTAEMCAKTGAKIAGANLDEQHAEARKRYQAEVLDF